MKLSEARAMRAAMLAGAATLDDATAASAPLLFPRWRAGLDCAAGDRLCYAGTLWRVLQAHTAQDDWTPDVSPSLYERIDVAHAGTLGDPIPYAGNMALESGKYYAQDGAVYLCTRDTGIPVYAALRDLVGLYVEEVSGA